MLIFNLSVYHPAIHLIIEYNEAYQHISYLRKSVFPELSVESLLI